MVEKARLYALEMIFCNSYERISGLFCGGTLTFSIR